jgi:hypothetical protein
VDQAHEELLRKGFFFGKKQQKTFVSWASGVGAAEACGPEQKFLRAFFKKRRLLCTFIPPPA